MPNVPYQPFATERPYERGTPEIRPAVPGAAFGENIGKAIEGFGVGLERDSNEIFNRAMALQELQNETEAKNADAKYMLEAGKMQEEFKTREGVNAGPKALEEHLGRLNGLRENMRGSLSNDQARRFYDASSIGFLKSTTLSAIGHAAAQQKVAYHDALNASNDLALKDLLTNPPATMEEFNERSQKIRDNVRNQGISLGRTPEGMADIDSKAVSKAASYWLTGKSRNEPNDSIKIFEENPQLFHPDDYERLRNTLYGQGIQVTASISAKKAMEEPDLSLREYQERAREEAEKSPIKGEADRERLFQTVEREVQARYYHEQSSIRDEQGRYWDTAVGGLIGRDNNNVVPATWEDLMANQNVARAYDGMNNVNRRRFEQAWVTAQRQGERVAPQISYQNFSKLRGMAQSEKAADFLDVNPFDPNIKMNFEDRRKIAELQNRMRADYRRDPQVARAFNWMRNSVLGQAMNELHVDRYSKQYAEDYYGFIGQLQAEIEGFSDSHNGAAPSQKDIIETIGPSLLNHTSGSWLPWNWSTEGFFGTDPYWKTQATDEFKQGLRDDAQRRGAPPPTDLEIARKWAAERLILLNRSKGK